MIHVTRPHFTTSGHTSDSDMMESQDNGDIYFRSIFAQSGFNSLSFEDRSELLKYLNSKKDEHAHPYMIYGDDLVYQESEGDLTLMYFGTIRGDE